MATRKVWDIEPNGDGKWEVKVEGGERASAIFDTKDLALAEARRLGRAEHERGGLAQVRVKGKDGTYQSDAMYG